MSNPAPRETPNPATSTRPRESSTRVARKRPLAWLPLAIVALLILLALLIAFLLAKANDDDDSNSDSAPSASTSTGVSTPAGSSADASGSSSGSSGVAAGSAAAAANTPLTVAGQDLLALSGGSLAAQAGKPATGTATVESVVSDEGFWVGASKSERVFVFLTPQARKSGSESGFQVTAGQKITLTGQVVTVASSPNSAAGVTDSEGKAQLAQQGALVRADSVTLS